MDVTKFHTYVYIRVSREQFPFLWTSFNDECTNLITNHKFQWGEEARMQHNLVWLRSGSV